MKYLRKFETEADVNMSVIPNVVLVGDTGKIVYNALNGVFIQHIDGTLYTTNEWTAGGFTNDQANGVAVGSGAVKFVIAKEDVSKSTWSSDGNNAVNGVMLTADESSAKKDYAGVENTNRIMDAYTSGTAAHAAVNYIFPSGAKGYLPALGELQIVRENMTAIKNAMTLIGGTWFITTKYWASTQQSVSNAWAYDWDYKWPFHATKTQSLYVRPFTTL